jgi:hypothetical protein
MLVILQNLQYEKSLLVISVVYLMASFPISNPSWMYSQNFTAKKHDEQFYVSDYFKFFLLSLLFVIVISFNNS